METCQSYYIAAGFRDDCTNLISEFDDSESSSFKEFTEIWNKMKFTLVFIGRSTKSESMEFCEEVLDIAKEFLLFSKKLKEKVGGIYLLYGLYFRMPMRGPKIRMAMSEWEVILNLQSELIHHHEYEAVFILNQLIKSSAFTYCRSEHERGLENYYVLKDFMKGNTRPVKSQKKNKELASIFDDLKDASENYVELKNNLEQLIGENVPRLFKIDEIEKMVEEVKNLDNIKPKKGGTSVKKEMNLRRSTRIDYSKPSTSRNNLDNILPSTSKDSENILSIKIECSGDSESSDDSSDSDY